MFFIIIGIVKIIGLIYVWKIHKIMDLMMNIILKVYKKNAFSSRYIWLWSLYVRALNSSGYGQKLFQAFFELILRTFGARAERTNDCETNVWFYDFNNWVLALKKRLRKKNGFMCSFQTINQRGIRKKNCVFRSRRDVLYFLLNIILTI